MSFQYYSEPIIPPPPPPGVQSVNDCGQPGVYVDNTDPLNPVVCFSGVITDATLTGNGTLALPLSVVPPNIQVNIGKTLYVSTLGNNATAVPYDIRKHYLTIPAALTAAVAGDTIVVFPGTYNVNMAQVGNLVKTGVNYYFMPGSIVQDTINSNVILFDVNVGQNIHIKGHGIFNNPNGSIIRMLGGNLSFDAHQCLGAITLQGQGNGNINFNCDTVDSNTPNQIAFFFTQNITAVINVREYIRAQGRCVQVEQNCNVVINCPKIYNNGTQAVYNTNGAFVLRSNLTTGKVVVNCDLMYSVNGNMVLIGSAQIGDGGSFIANIKRLINNYAGGTTHTILIANKCNYFQFNGNIYSNKAGQNVGLYYLNTNAINKSYIEFNGNIYNNLNYAIHVVGGGCTLNYSGDIYGNADDAIAVTPSGYGALVYIQAGANGWQTSTVTFNSCLFGTYNPNGIDIAIYKDMQLDAGGNELDNICNLLDCGFFLNNPINPVCDGFYTVIPNTFVTAGCISNASFSGTGIDITASCYVFPKFTLNQPPIAD